MTPKPKKGEIEKPMLSWENPIEVSMLEWLGNMIMEMNKVYIQHDDRSMREDAKNYVDAYRACRNELINQMRIRGKVDRLNEEE